MSSELSQALSTLLKYLERKGQLPQLSEFIILLMIQGLINNYTDIKLHVDWDKLVSLSVNSPMLRQPLWLLALEKLTRLGAQTNIVTELQQRKPLLTLKRE
jgi:hypothetical protein